MAARGAGGGAYRGGRPGQHVLGRHRCAQYPGQQAGQAGGEVGLAPAGAPVQGAYAAGPGGGPDREQFGEDRLRGGGAGRGRGLDQEDLPVVGDPPQLRPGGVEQAVVRYQPLPVVRPAQHPHRLRARPVLPVQPAGGGARVRGGAGQPGDGGTGGAGAGGYEQRRALVAKGPQQRGPAGPQRRRVRRRHPVPARPDRPDRPGHQLVERNAPAAVAARPGTHRFPPRCPSRTACRTHATDVDRSGADQSASTVTEKEKRSPR